MTTRLHLLTASAVAVGLVLLSAPGIHADMPSTGNATLDEALKFHADGDIQQAITLYRSVADTTSEQSHTVRALLGIGGCYLHLKDYDNAVPAFIRLADSYPDDAHAPLALVYAGNARMEQGLLPEARALYTRALAAEQDKPENTRVWLGWANLGMGHYLTESKQYREALPYLEAAIANAQEPKITVFANLYKSDCLAATGEDLKAIAALDVILGMEISGPYPENDIAEWQAKALEKKAALLENLGMNAEAEVVLTAMAAVQYSLDGQLAKARNAWREVSAKAPTSELGEHAAGNLAKMYADKASHGKGIEAMRELAGRNPNTKVGSAAALAVGRFLWSDKKYGEALEAFQEAIKRDANCDSGIDAVTAIKGIYTETGRSKELIPVLADIADRYRKSEAGAQARFYIAQTYRDQGKTEEARKAFLSVIERFPASQRAKDAKAMVFSSYWDKAMEFQKANDLSGAVEVWKQAYEYAADSRMKAEVLCIIEGTLLCLNRYEEVHKYAQMAYKLEPGSLGDWREGIRYYDAIACYRAGDYDAAVPILREIAATANDAETRQGIEAILQNIKSRRKKQ